MSEPEQLDNAGRWNLPETPEDQRISFEHIFIENERESDDEADPIDPRAFGLAKAAYAVGEALDLPSFLSAFSAASLAAV
jgi:hypothetical protein